MPLGGITMKKDKYKVRLVWDGIKDTLKVQQPCNVEYQLYAFIYVYGTNFINDEDYVPYLLECYNIFKGEIKDCNLSLMDFVLLVEGSGSDIFFRLKGYEKEFNLKLDKPSVYDFCMMSELIEKVLNK